MQLTVEDTRYMLVGYIFNVLLVMFTTFNSISHFFVCYYMSSQYRDTVRRMLRMGKVGTTVREMMFEDFVKFRVSDISRGHVIIS
ncbi:unnamed protein product [Caenorhabditis brenneri]